MKRIRNVVITLCFVLMASCSFNSYNPVYTQIEISKYRKPDSITLVSEDSSMASMVWRDYYTDRHLGELIDTALVRNITLYSAMLRIEQAASSVARSKKSFFPNVDFSISEVQKKTYNFSSPFDIHGIEFSISKWEIDLWGKLNSTKKAKLSAMMKETAVMQGVKVKLIADVAALYYRLIGLDSKLQAVNEIIDNNKAYLTEQEHRLQNGTLSNDGVINLPGIGITRSNIAIEQAKSELFKAKSIRPNILSEIFITENAINLLMSREYTPIARSTIEDILTADILSDTLYIGVPASLIRFRPDVIAAEYEVQEAFHISDAARAALYPQITLGADFGTFESNKSTWGNFSSSLTYNLFAGITQPLFRKGELKHDKRMKEIEANRKVAAYKQTVLTACTEVSNILMFYKMNHEKVVNLTKRYESLLKAQTYSRQLNKIHRADYLDVLAAQSQLLQTRFELSDAFIEYYTNRVAIFKALGGGSLQ